MKRLADSIKREAVQRVQRGETAKQVAKRYNVTRQAVEGWVKKFSGSGSGAAGWGGGGVVPSKPQDTGNVQTAPTVAPTPAGLEPLPGVAPGAFKPREVDVSSLQDDGPSAEEQQQKQAADDAADKALEEKALTSIRNAKRMLVGGAGELFFGDSAAPEIRAAADLSWPMEEAVKSNAPMIANAVGDTFAGPWGLAIAAILDMGITSWTMWKIWKAREELELKKLEAEKLRRNHPIQSKANTPPPEVTENSSSIPEDSTDPTQPESTVSPSPESPAAVNPQGLARLRIGGELITPAP